MGIEEFVLIKGVCRHKGRSYNYATICFNFFHQMLLQEGIEGDHSNDVLVST